MITVEIHEQIRRAYHIEHKSKRKIAREFRVARRTVNRVLQSTTAPTYHLKRPRSAPKLDPFKLRIHQLLDENQHLPRKQHWIGHTIFKQIQTEGYIGAEPSVRHYIGQRRRDQQRPEVFLPLTYDPGQDAQVDWGEAEVVMANERLTVQLFVIRLCYSRKIFVKAFPSQKQECFFAGHVDAFQYFGGIPHRLTYDNLSTAVRRVLEGHNREEQTNFILFRSHYLFASHFCTPGQGHEKGGVEHGVGYARRNFMVPIPTIESFEHLNAHLLQSCQHDDARYSDRQTQTIAEAFVTERAQLLSSPTHDFACCHTLSVALNPYSQITFETNRYSVPVDQARRTLTLKAYPFHLDILARRTLTLKAYPFHLDILDGEKLLARHTRCYQRQQDLFDPCHYLPLLEQRPGAFEHARPLRQWREKWSHLYEQVLAQLRQKHPEENGVRDFIRILMLHRQHPAHLVEQALQQALTLGCVHPDGVALCLRQLVQADSSPTTLDLSQQPHLNMINTQPISLYRYNDLLTSTERVV